MSKAFVVKNKEGRYYQRCYNQSPFTDDLFDANKYQYKEEAERILNNSFTLVDTLEVVEITIAEGDLKQQIAEKDREIERLKADLKSQKLATDVFSAIAASHHEFQEYDKILRKQICDKILELCDEKFRSINEFDFVEVISRDEVIEILDKIEEGIKE